MWDFFAFLKPVFVQAALTHKTFKAMPAAHLHTILKYGGCWGVELEEQKAGIRSMSWALPTYYKKFSSLLRFLCPSVGALQFLFLRGSGHRAVWRGKWNLWQDRIQQGGFMLCPWLVEKGDARACLLPTRSQKLMFDLWNTVPCPAGICSIVQCGGESGSCFSNSWWQPQCLPLFHRWY